MLIDDLGRHAAVAILRGVPDDQLLDVVGALHAGGVRLLEIAFTAQDSPAVNAARIASVIEAGLPELRVGAGTVLDTLAVAAAADAGAEFVLAPDTRPDVIRATTDRGLLSVPGALTPTEVGIARDAGADLVKIFPVSAVGPRYLRELHGPLPGIPFCAVGGVDAGNAADYLTAGALCVGVGSALFPRTDDGRVDLDGTTARAAALMAAVRTER